MSQGDAYATGYGDGQGHYPGREDEFRALDEKLILYLRGIADWSKPHPDLSRDMLLHEMSRINRQALVCIRMVESITEVNGDGGCSRDQAEAPTTDEPTTL